MFSPAWIDLILLVLAIGFLLRSPVLLTLGFLLTLTIALAWVWNRNVLRRVTFERTFPGHRFFPGDETAVEITIANRKLLPLAWLRWEDRFPAQADLLHGRLETEGTAGRRILSRGTTVRWYQRVRWRYPLRLPQRGLLTFGPATLRSGDLFGFFEQEERLAQVDRLLVYPRLVPLAELGLPARYLLGETPAPRQLFTDPVRTVGIRDYRPGDSFRHIHWPASARRQQLQVKVHEPVATLQLALFLDLDTFAHYWEGLRTEVTEYAISVAASVAKAAIEAGYAVGLYVNGVAAESDQPVRLAPSRHPGQLEQILEGLARLVPFSVVPMSRLLPEQLPRLALGSTVVLISSLARPDLLPVLVRLRDRGRRITLLYIGDDPPHIRGIHVHLLPLPAAARQEEGVLAPTQIVERSTGVR